MDHAEARELLELAAAEPGGLERLVAGDTPDAAVVAGHLAGCAECADEFDRLRRSAAVVRDAIRTTPPEDLRERTLAYVRAVGRSRGPAPAVTETGAVAVAGGPVRGGPAAPGATMGPDSGSRAGPWSQRLRPSWLVAIAAIVAVSVVASSAVVGLIARRSLDDRDAAIARQDGVVGALATVTTWSMRLSGEGDARSVRLTSPSGGPGSATVLYSPSTRELVVVGDALSEPPAGSELRCWVEVGGQRRPVGRMFFGGGLSYWVGDVEAVAGLTRGATFGISLVDADGAGSGSEPVVSGEL